MDWARILAYVTGTVDQELAARNEYLATENRILKDQRKPSDALGRRASHARRDWSSPGSQDGNQRCGVSKTPPSRSAKSLLCSSSSLARRQSPGVLPPSSGHVRPYMPAQGFCRPRGRSGLALSLESRAQCRVVRQTPRQPCRSSVGGVAPPTLWWSMRRCRLSGVIAGLSSRDGIIPH
jgi:hypothetical protein